MDKFSTIFPVNRALLPQIKATIDNKSMPLGALGQLEDIATILALVQQSLQPAIDAPHILVFAADHGIAQNGVSAYPQSVTWQMVMNFLAGGAAINVFANQHGTTLKVIDVGVNHSFEAHPQLENAKVAMGTHNFSDEAAMSVEQLHEAFQIGREQVDKAIAAGCNTIGFGEMGIANTSSAALIMSYCLDLPIADCTGRGTGITGQQLQKKIAILKKVKKERGPLQTSDDILQNVGGLEIAAMASAMRYAASRQLTILIDGFICTAAYLSVYREHPHIADYAIFCHQSEEQGHQKLLSAIGASPLLAMNLRLGEGTGCALAVPMLHAAVNFFNNMASFDSANVDRAS
ncbi:MAG: nicotinate-nucleotide--dimethylbenzimidazole phosphoribosyltransferase [Halioglobus sp.]|nr:nicotinate-nucleotide--dimethylbenzimidazole phosphoribosyltransferase [Halioglobus sp.]